MSTFDFAATIRSMHADGATRDEVIIRLVSETKCTLNKATKEYGKVAAADGWSSRVESYKDSALEYLADVYGDDWTADSVKQAVVELVSRFGVAESTARDYCKAYSEKLDVVHPIEDPRELMFNFLIENRGMAYDELKAAFKAYAKDELGRSPSNINEYWKGYDLHLALVAAGA